MMKTLERIAAVPTRVDDVQFSVLSGYDAGAWFDAAFAGERVPTLDAALAAIGGLGLGVNIELKRSHGREARLVEEMAGAVSRNWPARPVSAVDLQFRRIAPGAGPGHNARPAAGLDRRAAGRWLARRRGTARVRCPALPGSPPHGGPHSPHQGGGLCGGGLRRGRPGTGPPALGLGDRRRVLGQPRTGSRRVARRRRRLLKGRRRI